MMNFWQAIGTCFRKYADFSGRAQRSEFWWWILFSVLAILIITFTSFGFLTLIFSLVAFLPSIAVTARRLHDIDKSGWWQIMYLVPLVLVMLSALISSSQGNAFFGLIAGNLGLAFFASIIVLIVWLATKGTHGNNRFGTDPLIVFGTEPPIVDTPPQKQGDVTMYFEQAIGTCFRKYATFSGRAQRSEFWWWVLFSEVGGIIFSLLDAALFGMGPFIASQSFGISQFFGVLGTIFSLIIFLPNIAVTARRLHDIDKSGWWQIIGLPIIAILIFAFISYMPIIIGIAVVVLFAIAIILIVWWATKGTQGDNRFGPDPLANQMADAPPQNREM